MRRAALYVCGRIIIADSHVSAFMQLSESEKDDGGLVSGFFDPETQEFVSDEDRDHFYDKEMYLVRHGKSCNPSDPDPDISEEGQEQAAKVAYCLWSKNLQGFTGYTSPLLRCLRTADAIHRLIGIEFQIVPELVESPGDDVFKIRNRSSQFPQFEWPSSCEWHVLQETPVSFLQRAKDALLQLPGQSIVVTHFGLIHNMAKLALCDDKAEIVAEQGIPPGSVTYINRQRVLRLSA